MPTHIGFLRAVNIGKRQYKTTDLRAALEGAGYGDVETYIHSGNIRIDSPLRSRAKLEAELEALFLADRGFDVITVVLSPAELRKVAQDSDELGAETAPKFAQYVSLLKNEPSTAGTKKIESLSGNGERLVVRGRAVHLLYDIPYHEARASNAQVEKALGAATNRNAKVVLALAEKWA